MRILLDLSDEVLAKLKQRAERNKRERKSEAEFIITEAVKDEVLKKK